MRELAAASATSAEYVEYVSAKTVSYAGIVVALIPIMAVYPFLQRHYTKGIMTGSVKE